MSEFDRIHIPVLLKEVLELLAPQPGDVYLDGTLGLGGHAGAVADIIGRDGILIGLDRDQSALALARERLAGKQCHCYFFHKPYSQAAEAVAEARAGCANQAASECQDKRQIESQDKDHGGARLRCEKIHSEKLKTYSPVEDCAGEAGIGGAYAPSRVPGLASGGENSLQGAGVPQVGTGASSSLIPHPSSLDAAGAPCPEGGAPARRGVGRGAGVDRILIDIGVSSLQLDAMERGFSFRADAPLDMRMDTSRGPTAADFVAQLPEAELADIIYKYGEERFSRRIAKRIAEERVKKPINTTGELASLVRSCVPGPSRIDKATRTFQALRIAVNDELGELERGLAAFFELLNVGGRLAVISFHSLEDRIVKEAFKEYDGEDYRTLTKKPVTASEDESIHNPRARSAKLRVIERVG